MLGGVEGERGERMRETGEGGKERRVEQIQVRRNAQQPNETKTKKISDLNQSHTQQAHSQSPLITG